MEKTVLAYVRYPNLYKTLIARGIAAREKGTNTPFWPEWKSCSAPILYSHADVFLRFPDAVTKSDGTY